MLRIKTEELEGDRELAIVHRIIAQISAINEVRACGMCHVYVFNRVQISLFVKAYVP